MVKKALILAAGMGSRLRPLTDTTPKALLEFRGKTMLDHVLDKLLASGVQSFVINLHHLGDQIEEYLSQDKYKSLDISFSHEEEQLMDTGGAILKAREYLDDDAPFLLHNIDIYSDIDLQRFYKAHLESASLASLAVSQRKTSRNFLVDAGGILCGWRNNQTGEEIISREAEELSAVAFSGIHILDPKIFNVLQIEGPFSITNAYLDLAREHTIQTWDHSGGTWIDMAHRDNFPQLNK